MRLQVSRPLSEEIGCSTVFAKPPRLQPHSAPPRNGVRPRRVAAKTGSPALPLRHRPRRPYPHLRMLRGSIADAVAAGARALFSKVRPGARAPPLVAGEPPHQWESALRARSLAALFVRLRPVPGPRRTGELRRPASRRRRGHPWHQGSLRPPGWPTAVCGVAALLRMRNQPSRNL
ncbi:hypothetical protein GQ55_6G144200 [Panicum hallii var. hallii]|uniref:Uncharacterized protein n=1 Tax=Panicum hallii var. hallii TaxID=1504633 RepID=A0A2T7D679_9POAL|nr:hypothetical protein GQ55_6G144200 [Panicum hallii var. hallii]